MSFADPQSVTIGGTAYPLPRVGSGVNTGTFRSADGLVQLGVASAYGKRTRRTIRLDHSKVAADPFNSSINAKYSMSAYLVVDVPVVGYTVSQQGDVANALTAYLTATTNARMTQLLGGEN